MKFDSKITSVVGLQFGDEGKGQLVDFLTQQHEIVVRYNGGANAGHAVKIGNQRFVLHQIPIGCLTKEKVGVIGNGVVLHVPALLHELAQLKELGIIDFRLKISCNAHLVMPYHFLEESLRHRLACKLGTESLGTTLKGIGPCYADKASRDTGLRVEDLFEPERLKSRLLFILALKNATISALSTVVNDAIKPLSLEPIMEECREWAEALQPYKVDTCKYLFEQEKAGRTILFEGANAAALDLDFGTYPFVTSSNGSNLGMTSGTGFLPENPVRRFGVIKTYMSRVGAGPFPTELSGEIANGIRVKGCEYGSTTERPRRIGWLDIPGLQDAVNLNRITDIVLTGLFVLAQLDEFYVCVSYQGGEPVLEHFAVDGNLLDKNEELSEWCKKLIALVEEQLAPVSAICVGPSRHQLVWL